MYMRWARLKVRDLKDESFPRRCPHKRTCRRVWPFDQLAPCPGAVHMCRSAGSALTPIPTRPAFLRRLGQLPNSGGRTTLHHLPNGPVLRPQVRDFSLAYTWYSTKSICRRSSCSFQQCRPMCISTTIAFVVYGAYGGVKGGVLVRTDMACAYPRASVRPHV